MPSPPHVMKFTGNNH